MKYTLFCIPLLLAACDTTGERGEPATHAGTHTIQTQGAYAESLEGRALFAPSLFDGQPAFTLQLQTARENPNVLVSLDWPGQASPAPGTYSAVATFADARAGVGRVAVSYVRSSSSPFFFEQFRPTGGTVTITEATAQRLRGTLSVSLSDAGRTLTLAGTFTARAGH
jgi:uridine phosphorylase